MPFPQGAVSGPERVSGDRQGSTLVARAEDVALRGHRLNEGRLTDGRPGNVEVAVLEVKRQRAVEDLLGPRPQRVVDLSPQLPADDHEDHYRGDDHGESDRNSSHQRQPGAEAHDGSRSA